MALCLNPQLAIAREAIASAQGDERVAFSGYLPTFQANSGFQAFHSNVGSLTTASGRFVYPVRGFGPGSQDFNVTDLQVKWIVWDFGRQVALHGQSLLKLDIARLQWERARQTMDFDVIQAYNRVLQNRVALRTADEAYERAQAFLTDARELLRRGALSLEDTLRAEAQCTEVQQQIHDARSDAELAVVTLNRAIGLNVNSPTRVVETQEAPPAFNNSLEECLQLAVDHRPEFEIVRKGILAAESEVTVARAEYFPIITTQSVYSNVTGTGVQNSNVRTGGIFVNLEVYTGGRRKGRLQSARAQVRTACAQAQQICDGIAYEVHVAFRGANETHDRIKVAQAAVAQARNNLRLIEDRYRNKQAKPTDVIEAQTNLREAEQSLNASYYDCRIALARLEYAVGGAIASSNVPLPQPTTPNAVAPVILPSPIPYSMSPFAFERAHVPVAEQGVTRPTPAADGFRTLPHPPGLGQPGSPAQPTNIAPTPLTVPPIP
jgi:outer membrane protein TolC